MHIADTSLCRVAQKWIDVERVAVTVVMLLMRARS